MLILNKVRKEYKLKKQAPVVALNDIDLKLADTGMVFILGKSGSGKSTFLNVVGGLDSFDSGEIIINGKSSNGFSQKDFDSYRNTYVGFIFQEYNILEDLTVEANVSLALELQGKKVDQETIENILKSVDLEGLGDRKPKELSGGQKQRVAIARAIVKDPEIIMADEPTGALDSVTGKQVLDTLKKLSKERLVIVVSHDRDFATTYADRIVEFKDGNIISDVIVKQDVESSSLENKKNLFLLNNDYIYIDKEYALSPQDIELLISKLNGCKENKYIILNPSFIDKTENIVKMKEYQQEGKGFVPTSEEDNINDSNKDFKSIKSRLSFKNSFFFGLNSLKVKPLRLALVVLMTSISLALFGFVDTISSYSPTNLMTNSIVGTKIDYASFTKRYATYDWKSNVSADKTYEDGYLGTEDIERLNEKFNIDFKGVYKNDDVGDFSLSHNLLRNYNSSNEYYVNELSGIIEVDEDTLDSLNYKLAYGRMPQNENEIVITDYTYHLFCEQGYHNYFVTSDRISISQMTPYETNMESCALVDGRKELYINNQVFTVTGILDTKFDFKKYEILIENIEESSYKYLAENYALNIKYGYHNLGYLYKGSLKNIISNNQLNLLNVVTDYGLSCQSGKYNFNIKYVGNNSQKPEDTITYSTTLDNGEAIVSSSFLFGEIKTYDYEENDFPQYGGWYPQNSTYVAWKGILSDSNISLNSADEYKYGGDYDNLYDLYNNIKEAYLRQYAYEHIDEAHANGYDEVYDAERYYQFLADVNPTQGDHGFNANPYGENGSDLIEKEKKRLLEEYAEQIMGKTFKISVIDPSKYLDNQTSESFTVKGFYLAKNDVSSHCLIISDYQYEQYCGVEESFYAFAIGKMPKNYFKVRKLVNFEDKSQDVYYSLQNESKISLKVLDDTMKSARDICLYIGLGLLAFSMVFFFNFISVSIANKKRDIGILRAIGSRSHDVVKIFFIESLIIALGNFIVSLIVLLIASSVMNSIIIGNIGLQVALFTPGFRQICIMLLISVTIAYASCAIPIYSFARKKPINIIKDN